MGATIIKIKPETKKTSEKPLSSLQKKLLEGPVMSEKEYLNFKKVNRWMAKWKV